jgi:MYXO-CTERM domain-containing protein
MRRALTLAALLLPSLAAARDFHVEPGRGSSGGDGSAASPWKTLQEVVAAGLLTDGTVTGGDRLLLGSGYHGELTITGGGNATPIVFEAAPGATPALRRVLFRNTSGWTLRGVSVSPSHAPTYTPVTLVDIDGASSHDIVIEDNELFSQRDSSSWTAQDWLARECDGISVDGARVVVRRNRLRNVRFGISVSGPDALVSRNEIVNFANDGIRGLGDRGVFEHNLIANSFAIDDNHDDGFQSWSVGPGGVGTGEVVGVVLRGNVIVNYTDPAQPMKGTLQGIGCFDGFFVDWVVENNVVITDHWHGITLLGSRGARVFNNTVLDPNGERPGPPWIQIAAHKDGRPSVDAIIRNNLVTDLANDSGATIVEDHNLIITDPAATFVDVAAGDVRLRAGSPAIDQGSAEGAPATDIEGAPRPAGSGFDVGAYEYRAGVSPFPDGGVGDAGAGLDGGGAADDAGGGCGCRAGPGGAAGGGWWWLAALPLALRRRH